ncbi:MAG TPA: DNA-directed RNA polymerase subunit E'' [Nanoarchaeota archaeon]|nr:DNA-directed RNA polymerase subunit E'' [Nanoarchaeota archaeon]
MSEFVCKICKRILKSDFCPVCKTNEVTKSWKGVLVVFDSDSELAKAAGITAPGKYAVRVK